MAKRTALLISLISSLALLPGCPGALSGIVGTWVITYANLDRGLELMPNGQAVPFMIDTLIAGTVTWEIDGDRVVFYQDTGTGNIVWAAVLTSNTTMSGQWIVWAGNGVGNKSAWTAAKQ